MPNYPTSYGEPSMKKLHRYVVTYEDEKFVYTFSVHEYTASGATARVIDHIRETKFDIWDRYYFLTPEISDRKTDFEIT